MGLFSRGREGYPPPRTFVRETLVHFLHYHRKPNTNRQNKPQAATNSQKQPKTAKKSLKKSGLKNNQTNKLKKKDLKKVC